MSTKAVLTEEDYARAAEKLSCEVACIKAVTEVEAPRGGFLPDGRVTILFERHKFFKYTGGRFAQSHPDICNASAGGYGPAGAHQYERFSLAFSLDAKAAMMSTSFGKFQIMGFNFHSAGFESVDDFVSAMKESEGRQLDAFVSLVSAWGLASELRRHDWARFAAAYNGADYRKNRYDVKLAAGYKKHLSDTKEQSKQHSEELVGASIVEDLPEVSDASASDAISESPNFDAQTPATTADGLRDASEAKNAPQPDSEPKKATPATADIVVAASQPVDAGAKKSLRATVIGVATMAATWLSTNVGEAFGFIKENAIDLNAALKWCVIVAGALIALYILRQIVMSAIKWVSATLFTLHAMKYHADPQSNNVSVGEPAPPPAAS